MAKVGKYKDDARVKLLSEMIISYRAKTNVTRAVLAEKMKITERQLIKIEQCNATCKFTTFLQILEVIGYDNVKFSDILVSDFVKEN